MNYHMDIENFTKKIPQNLLLDFIFIIAQASLTLCLYLNININFRYIYIGTYLVILYLVIKILYLVTWFIVSIFKKKIMLAIGLFFYIGILSLICMVVLFVSLLPVVGINAN